MSWDYHKKKDVMGLAHETSCLQVKIFFHWTTPQLTIIIEIFLAESTPISYFCSSLSILSLWTKFQHAQHETFDYNELMLEIFVRYGRLAFIALKRQCHSPFTWNQPLNLIRTPYIFSCWKSKRSAKIKRSNKMLIN